MTWVKSSPAIAGSKSRIWLASASGKFHKQLNVYDAFDAQTQAISTIRTAKGQSMTVAALAKELVYVQMDTVSPDGTKSPGSNTVAVFLA